MTNNFNAGVVDAVIREGPGKDRQARIAQLETQLARVRNEAEMEAEMERHYQTIQRAFAKLKAEMGKTLTIEERQALDGAYIFLHSGCVDVVRSIPSATDKGEGNRFLEKLDVGEALEELRHLSK